MKGLEHNIPSAVFPKDHNLAILGHELGNVLNGLLGMAELLGDSGLTVEQVRWLKAIQQSGRQMESLIRCVWSFNKVNEPDIVPRRERVDGMEMLEHLVISHTPAARLQRNQLVLVVHPEMPRYWRLDGCLVRQLLDNLTGNATKFTCGGEIVIEASPDTDEGEVNGAVRFRVSDTGPGFDEAEAEHIFGAYQRLRDSGDGIYANRGLGLYICRNIAQAMRGKISCKSSAAGGACFQAVIPEALNHEEKQRHALHSSLLDPIVCQLKLGRLLRRSVENFLIRLGVRFSESGMIPPCGSHVLVISEAPHQETSYPPSLLLAPNSRSGSAPRQKTLATPVLESSLSCALLEIALEWRSLAFREARRLNENRGSAPRRR